MKNKILDILLIVCIIVLSLLIRLPSANVNNLELVQREYFLNEEGVPYLRDFDSYYYSKITKSFFNNTGEYSLINQNFFPFLVSILYRLIGIFSNISIDKFIYFIVPFLSALSAIPAYIFVRKRTNRLGGLIAGILATVNIGFLINTNFGCYDTDALLCFLPLVLMTTFIEYLECSDLKHKLIYGIISLISFIFLILTWEASIVYFVLIACVSITVIILYLIKYKTFKNEKIYSSLIILIIFLILTLILNSNLFDFFKGLVGQDEFPAASTFVSEMNKIPILAGDNIKNKLLNVFNVNAFGVINHLGGLATFTIFVSTLIYFIVFTIKKLIKKEVDLILPITLIAWSIGGLVSIYFGSRFVKVATVPECLLVGIGIGKIFSRVNKKTMGICFIAFISLMIFAPLISSIGVANRKVPSHDDALVEISNYVKDNTKSDAVIISWWDNGYLYEDITGLKVVMDGGTYNGEFYYWYAKAILSTNELYTKNILKMMANSGVDASKYATKLFDSAEIGSKVIDEIAVLKYDSAYKLLTTKYNLNEDESKKLLDLVLPNIDYEVIAIVTDDMMNIKKAISYYGNWNFKTSKMADIDEEALLNRLYKEKKDMKHFKLLNRVIDPLSLNGGSIWLIK